MYTFHLVWVGGWLGEGGRRREGKCVCVRVRKGVC
jgi:hypothetical protein